MSKDTGSEQIKEAVGVFIEARDLKRAAAELLDSGFERGALGLLAGQEAVERSLGELDAAGREAAEDAGPETDFVRHESVGDAVHAWVGGVSLAGTTALGATAVASAAVLGGALIAATAGLATVGAVGAAMTAVIHKSDAEYLEEQIDGGRLLLFVRCAAPDDERRATEIFARHEALDTKVVSVSRSGS